MPKEVQVVKELSWAEASRLIKAQRKVSAHRATEAGTLRQAYAVAQTLAKVCVDLKIYNDDALTNDIKILEVALKRFTQGVKRHSQRHAAGMEFALGAVGELEQLLAKAKGPGFGIKAVAASAQTDEKRVHQLRESLRVRSREAAFVLAELENLADPLPNGFKMASARKRKAADKLRTA